jgi:hypothetical protein
MQSADLSKPPEGRLAVLGNGSMIDAGLSCLGTISKAGGSDAPTPILEKTPFIHEFTDEDAL